MSTRSTISVFDNRDQFAIYRHHDGYPSGEHGVIHDLKKATDLAWDPPRFEAADFAAAVVAAMKHHGGSVYLTRDAEFHGDRDFHYGVSFADKAVQVCVHDFTARAEKALIRFNGPLDGAVEVFEAGLVESERLAMIHRVWEALSGAEYALADMETARRKGRLPDIRRQVFAAMDAHRAERRSASAVPPED